MGSVDTVFATSLGLEAFGLGWVFGNPNTCGTNCWMKIFVAIGVLIVTFVLHRHFHKSLPSVDFEQVQNDLVQAKNDLVQAVTERFNSGMDLWTAVVQPIDFQFIPTAKNNSLVKCIEACGVYVPFVFANIAGLGGHLQSAMFACWCSPRLLISVSKMEEERELVKSTKDGGEVALVWWNTSEEDPPAKGEEGTCAGHREGVEKGVVLILPGVVGRVENIYIKRLGLHFARELGWKACAKSWRGIGTGLASPRCETWDEMAMNDTLDVLDHIRAKMGKDVPIFGVGFSFGGALLTAVTGRIPKERHHLSGVVSISGMFDFTAMSKHLEEQKVYDALNCMYTLKNYKEFGGAELVAQNSVELEKKEEKPEDPIAQIHGHKDFHQTFTIQFTKDETVDDYILRIEKLIVDSLPTVNVPLLALMAKDDPLCPEDAWKKCLKNSAGNENIIVATTERGGHCGWWTGTGDSWVDEVTVSFVSAVMGGGPSKVDEEVKAKHTPKGGDAVATDFLPEGLDATMVGEMLAGVDAQ